MKEAVIFDWQGTLVDVSGIRHLVESGGYRNFPEFHRQTGNCPPIQDTVRALWNAIQDDDKVIVLMTGCTDDFRDVLTSWMMRNDVMTHAVLMRRAGDYRADVAVKLDMLTWVREQGFTVVHAWDDNPNVLKLWQDEGIPTTVVPGWTGS